MRDQTVPIMARPRLGAGKGSPIVAWLLVANYRQLAGSSAASEVTDEGEILPSSTDYEGIYGKTLETLEAEWLVQLQGSS